MGESQERRIQQEDQNGQPSGHLARLQLGRERSEGEVKRRRVDIRGHRSRRAVIREILEDAVSVSWALLAGFEARSRRALGRPTTSTDVIAGYLQAGLSL